MAATEEAGKDVQLTRENVVAYQEWLGNLVARALFDHGAISFFIDSDGDVRLEIPTERIVTGSRDGAGDKITKKEE
jgi:hypothetical protein